MNKELKRDAKLQERLIHYLIKLPRLSRPDQVSVNSAAYGESPIKNINGQKLTEQLYRLQSLGYILIDPILEDDSESFSYRVTLQGSILSYDKNKHDAAIESRNKWIQFWIPVILSIIAITISAISLFLELRPIEQAQLPTSKEESTDGYQANLDSCTTESNSQNQPNYQYAD